MHDKIRMLAQSKLNSIEALISQALMDKDISHEEFITILKEKDRCKMMKDNLRYKKGESYEIIKIESEKPKNQASLKNKIIIIIIFLVYIKMLDITRKNCYKCNLETIILNDSQYFWINIKDFEVGTECKLINMEIHQL